MKTRIKNLSLQPALIAGLGLMLAGRVTAQNFTAWPVTRIAAGGYHTLFTRSDGTLYVMGDNTYGQLGLGPTLTNVNVPQILTNGVGAVAAGEYHSLFLSGRGLWAMGENGFGQLGDGTANNAYYPEKVFSLGLTTYFTAIAAGGYHSLFGTLGIVAGSGGLWAMGQNEYGQLGDSSFTGHYVPEEIVSYSPGSPTVTAVAGGELHTLFIKSDGSLWGMGYNYNGQLGYDVSSGGTNRPTQLFAGYYGTATAIAAGGLHSLWITSEGNLLAVGDDQYGELGDGNGDYYFQNVSPMLAAGPYTETGLSNVVIAVAAGFGHTLFIMSDGSLWAAGNDVFGQLGNGAAGGHLWTDIPEMIVASNVVAVAAGQFHSLFIKSDGSLWGMGLNNSGQLGTGDYIDRDTPVEIVSPPPQISIIPYEANVILAWPSNAVGFNLQSTANLTPPVVWSTNAPAPVLIGDQFEVFTPVSGRQQFYRLIQ